MVDHDSLLLALDDLFLTDVNCRPTPRSISDYATLLNCSPEELRENYALLCALHDFVLIEDDAEPKPSKLYGEWRPIRPIGEGGEATVWRAVSCSPDNRYRARLSALKVRTAIAGDAETARKRHKAELNALQLVDTPYRPQLINHGDDGIELWIAMELIDGSTLSVYAGECTSDGSARDYASIALAGAQLAYCLQAAHQEGLVHRDVKPDNIKFRNDHTPALLDFGIVKPALSPATVTGEHAGTKPYMSPEQVRGEPLDARTDVWSLGVTLYEWLARRRAFSGTDEALSKAIPQVSEFPLWKHDPTIPRALAHIVHHAIRKERSRRYTSAEEMASQLLAFVNGTPITVPAYRYYYERIRLYRPSRAVLAWLVTIIILLSVTTVIWLNRFELRIPHFIHHRTLVASIDAVHSQEPSLGQQTSIACFGAWVQMYQDGIVVLLTERLPFSSDLVGADFEGKVGPHDYAGTAFVLQYGSASTFGQWALRRRPPIEVVRDPRAYRALFNVFDGERDFIAQHSTLQQLHGDLRAETQDIMQAYSEGDVPNVSGGFAWVFAAERLGRFVGMPSEREFSTIVSIAQFEHGYIIAGVPDAEHNPRSPTITKGYYPLSSFRVQGVYVLIRTEQYYVPDPDFKVRPGFRPLEIDYQSGEWRDRPRRPRFDGYFRPLRGLLPPY